MGRRSGRPQDGFGKRAKDEGYAARSIYKLEEIDRRVRLLRRGQRVLDLGGSPGSWSQYAAEKVGPQGRVLAIDLNPARVALPPQATFEERDVMATDPAELGEPGRFDVVLSDMAPSTSGQRHADQFLSFELYCRALDFAARTVLKRVLELYEARNWTPIVAPELEFFLVRVNTDPD